MTTQDYKKFRQQFASRVARLRRERDMTQEQLAELIDKTTDYISLLERGERSPSFEVIIDIAHAFDIPIHYLMNFTTTHNDPSVIVEVIASKPVDPTSVQPVDKAIVTSKQRISDVNRLKNAVEGLEEMQRLAQEYGIQDIFQDNGGKTLQLLILLGLRISPGREGNDAIDADGKEYELKTVNVSRKKNPGITTHHHLNHIILAKYRQVEAWYIGIYEDITLKKIYKLSLPILEPLFQQWEQKLKTKDSLNNPKIPMKLVKHGEIVYSDD